MKLKVKLSEEYGKKIVKDDSPDADYMNIAYDWLQGFEKAREMAQEVANTVQNSYRGGDTSVENLRLNIGWAIKNFGEEEVKPD